MAHMKSRIVLCCALLLTLALNCAGFRAAAQSSTQGAIAGTAVDGSGSVVAGAKVVINNNATGFTVAEASDGSGFFNAPLLEPGDYSVSVTAAGFAAFRAEHVVVQVGQVTTVAPVLSVGSTSTSVEVSEQVPVLNLDSPDFTDTLNLQALQSVPINNRRWSSLAMTTPGVVSDGNGYGLVSVRGISPLLNNVEIDGADDNQAFFAEERGRTREAYSTSANAVREFAVNTGVYSAEYGRAAGGVINSVTKSGTNNIHGEAYFYDRESNWNAFNDYTTIATVVNGANVTEHIKPEDLRKIYGFTVGGPLIKDKLFWMYTYDQHTHVFPEVGIPYNPLNFYTLPAATLPAGATCKLTPTAPETAGNGYLSGDTATLDREACTLAARQGITYAQAAADWAALINGGTLSNGATDLGLNSDLGQVSRFGYQEINTPKLDWQITPREHLSVLYHRLRWDSPGGVQTAAAVNYARDSDGNDFVKLDYGVTKLTSLITSTISNELLYQYGRELDDEGQQTFTPYTLADINNKSGNIPYVQIGASSSGWGFNAGSPYYSYRVAYPLEKKWQVGDTLYWAKGNHTFKFGVDAVHNFDFQNNLYEGNGEYSYQYIGLYFNDLLDFKNGVAPNASKTGSNFGCDANYTEYATSATSTVVNGFPCYADFYQGFGTPTFSLSTMDTGVFAQDNWKISPRLTLELGLRWDHEALPGPNRAFIAPTGNFTPYPQLANHPSDNADLGPRFGFSFDLFGHGNSVLRGGYGLYYGRITNGNLLEVLFDTGSPAAQTSPTFFNAPTSTISEGPQYPNIFASGASTAKPTSYYFSSNLKLPQVQEFDLQLQQSVGKGTFLSLSYLGGLGRRLPNFLNTNLEPCTAAANACETKPIAVSDASGKGPIPTTNGVGSLTINNIYTAYGNTALFGAAATNFAAITEMTSNVNSSYNAFVVEILNRSLKSLQFDANYTWSHALDFSQNANTEGATESWYDPYGNYQANYGNSAYNVPNRFVAYALYSFPNLHSENLLKWVANDWSIDTSFQMQNGLPYTGAWSGKISGAIGSDYNGAGGLGIIPGYIGVNTYQYPRHIVDDLRVQKQFTFHEARPYQLQFLANAFNLANHQNITAVGATSYTLSGSTLTYLGQGSSFPTNNTLGVPTNSNSSGFLYTPRQIEIAARLVF
jgi:hypothetical protein